MDTPFNNAELTLNTLYIDFNLFFVSNSVDSLFDTSLFQKEITLLLGSHLNFFLKFLEQTSNMFIRHHLIQQVSRFDFKALYRVLRLIAFYMMMEY